MKHIILFLVSVVIGYIGWQLITPEWKAKAGEVLKRHVGTFGLILLLAVLLISWFLNSQPVKLF